MSKIHSRAMLIVLRATRLQTREGATIARAKLSKLASQLGSDSLTQWYLDMFDCGAMAHDLPRRTYEYTV